MMSNLLAREGRLLFYSSRASGIHGLARVGGICGRKMEIGDQVVRIMGLSHLLVLRPMAEDESAMKIVSPAALLPTGLYSSNIPRGKGQADECIEYRIQ